MNELDDFNLIKDCFYFFHIFFFYISGHKEKYFSNPALYCFFVLENFL